MITLNGKKYCKENDIWYEIVNPTFVEIKDRAFIQSLDNVHILNDILKPVFKATNNYLKNRKKQ